MMRRIFYTIGILFLLWTLPAAAELYKCGDLWSTSPCGDGSAPVENLPEVKAVAKQSTSSAKEIYVPRIKSFGEFCSPTGKARLVIERAILNSEGDNYLLDLSIRNATRNNFSGALYVSIVDTQRSIGLVKSIARYIPYGSSDLFSVSLQGVAPKWYYGKSLTVRLLYDKDAFCEKKEVALPPLSLRPRKRFTVNDPFLKGEASVLLNTLSEEQDEVYTALPSKGKSIDAYLQQVLLLKAEEVIRRHEAYCAKITESSLVYRCGVLGERFRSLAKMVASD